MHDSAGNVVFPVGPRTVYDADGRPLTPPGGHPIPSHYEPDEGGPSAPSGAPYGGAPSGAPYGDANSGAPYGGAPSGVPYGGAPSAVRVPASQYEPDQGVSGAPPHRIPTAPSTRPGPGYDEHGVPVAPPAESMYGDQRVPFTEEHVRPLPGRPITPERYSPRPTVTPFPGDLAQADAERERLECLAEVENRLQEVAGHAQVAEDQRENDFRRNEEDRERIFMESEERREQEARERQEAIWRDMQGLGAAPPPPRPPTIHTDVGDGASMHTVHTVQAASEEAASLLAASIKDTVQAEREQFAREREELAAERAQLEAERDSARRQLMEEKEAHVRALEEELATLRGELENEKQLRSTDDSEARERERQALADSSETRAQLGDITNLIQDQREACERKKELMEERWNEKQQRRQDKEYKWVELQDMVRKIHDDMESDRQKAEDARLADESKPGPFYFFHLAFDLHFPL